MALQTIYSTFGSKSGLLLALVDTIDEEAGAHDLYRQMIVASDPREMVGHFARIRRQIRERCGDLIELLRAGARVEADFAEAWAEGMRRRHGGLSEMVRRIAEAGALREGLDPHRAADIAAALATDDICDVLVLQRGWTYDEYDSGSPRRSARFSFAPNRETTRS